MIRRTAMMMAMIAAMAILTLTAASCGGGGGGGVTVIVSYGSIDGYVYANVGSGRAAEAAPAGQMPLAGANVAASGGGVSKSTTTNSEGYFKITSLPAGSCTLTISKTGYGAKSVNATVSANNTTRVGGSSGTKMTPAASGALRVTANVAGVEVIIDGIETGIDIPAGLGYTFNEVSAGEHEVNVDWTGYAPTATQTVEVASGNTTYVSFELGAPDMTPPVADAGDDGKTFVLTRYTYAYQYGDIRDYTPYENEYELDGSGSSDNGGGALIYEWTRTSGPAATLSSSSAQKPKFTPRVEGTYTFRLRVRDAQGNWSNPDYVSVYAGKPSGKIAYYGGDNHDEEIMTVNADGTSLAQLTSNTTNDRDPAWSPDGEIILYYCDPTGSGANKLCIINSNGTGYEILPLNDASTGSYSPDGSEITYGCTVGGYPEICKVNNDYTNFTQLTNLRLSNGTMFPRFSPDGDKILFVAYFGGDNLDVYVMNSDGSGEMNITEGNYSNYYPTWTHAGRVLYTEAPSLSDNFKLRVMNIDGTGKQDWPVPNVVNDVSSPQMSEDERFIFYFDNGNFLNVMYADGSGNMNYGLYSSKLDYHPGP